MDSNSKCTFMHLSTFSAPQLKDQMFLKVVGILYSKGLSIISTKSEYKYEDLSNQKLDSGTNS